MWAAFIGFVLVMLVLDLFVFGGNKAHKVSAKEAASWTLVWVSMALLFNAGLWWYLNGTQGRAAANEVACHREVVAECRRGRASSVVCPLADTSG